jgi:XisI protein
MDKLENYREIIQRILSEYASVPYAYVDIKSEPIFDRDRDSYLLVNVGWNKGRRMHGCLVHIDIINGKIWIYRDGTDDGIATDLEREGISKSDIVLAFHEPELRKYTEYAIA